MPPSPLPAGFVCPSEQGRPRPRRWLLGHNRPSAPVGAPGELKAAGQRGAAKAQRHQWVGGWVGGEGEREPSGAAPAAGRELRGPARLCGEPGRRSYIKRWSDIPGSHGLSRLPKPGSPKRPCCFRGSFRFGFSQGRGQAGFEHRADGLALKSKAGAPGRPAFAILILLRGFARAAEARVWPCPCSASSQAPLPLPGHGGAAWSPLQGPHPLPAPLRSTGTSLGTEHFRGHRTAGPTVFPAHTLAHPSTTTQGTETTS